MLDPIPVPTTKYMFRVRDKSKELGPSTFRTKTHNDIQRLNELYENDLKILDCEKVLGKQYQKKRLSWVKAEKLQAKKEEKIQHKLKMQRKDSSFISSELYKQEYDKLARKAFKKTG